jgi:hypothetical protein
VAGFWTDDRVERLESLWSRGYSAGAIAELLVTTRNAVAGKAWRLQLPEREVIYTKPAKKRRPRPHQAFTLRPRKAKPPAPPRHNGDFSWHLAQVAAGVRPRGSPPAPPPGYPSWRTFRRRCKGSPALLAA